jgi:hypothetical protein
MSRGLGIAGKVRRGASKCNGSDCGNLSQGHGGESELQSLFMLRLVIALVSLSASAVLACPTCSCANPALLSIGADQPYPGRLRFGTTFRAWQQVDGIAGADGATLRELRLDLLASWSPLRRWTFAIDLPLQVRERTEVSLARERGFGPGDLNVSARFLVVGAEGLRRRHLVSVVGAMRLPTAPTLRDEVTGREFALDAQLAPGALAPGLGAAWSSFVGDRWSTMLSLNFELPLEGRFGLRIGPTVQLVGWAQFQPWPRLGFRAGVDARYEAVSFIRGVADASNSGVLLQPLLDLIVAPLSRVMITAGARVPFSVLRSATISQSPIIAVSLVVDV